MKIKFWPQNLEDKKQKSHGNQFMQDLISSERI
jgi:hypothetical protein